MKATRFGLLGGALWASASLLLVAISLTNGTDIAWLEVDFRPLTASAMLAAKAIGSEVAFSHLVSVAEYGLPIKPLPVGCCVLLSFGDGFASGYLIALLYNLFSSTSRRSQIHPSLSFGAASGIVLGISSGMLALAVKVYGIDIQSFDFAVRPVWGIFHALSRAVAWGWFEALRQSYMYFPETLTGALAWTGWGFIDGFVAGLALSFPFLEIRRRLSNRHRLEPTRR